jgi:hypothetical protein
MMQKPVAANQSMAAPTKPVKASHHGLVHEAEAEALEHVADDAEAAQRDADRREAGDDDEDDPPRIVPKRQRGAAEENGAGDEPHGALDVPAVDGDDVDAGTLEHADRMTSRRTRACDRRHSHA